MKPLKYPLASAFEKWVVEQPDEFGGHEPHLVSRSRGVSRYRFRGIASALSLHIGEDGRFSVQATYRKVCFDILREFDFVPFKSSRGYVCDLCKGRTVYASLDQLMIEHTGKPLAAWVKESFRPGKRLVLVRDGGATTALIASKVPKGANSVPLILRRERRLQVEGPSYRRADWIAAMRRLLKAGLEEYTCAQIALSLGEKDYWSREVGYLFDGMRRLLSRRIKVAFDKRIALKEAILEAGRGKARITSAKTRVTRYFPQHRKKIQGVSHLASALLRKMLDDPRWSHVLRKAGK